MSFEVPVGDHLKEELRAALYAALERAVKKGLTHDQFGGSIRSAIRKFARAHDLDPLETNMEEVVGEETRLTKVLPEIEYGLAIGELGSMPDKLVEMIEKSIGIAWQTPPKAEAAPRAYDPKTAYEVGDTVIHANFGAGKVMRCEGKRVAVQFTDKERLLAHGLK